MSNSPCSPGQQPPQSEPYCMYNDKHKDTQFCLRGDGTVTFKTDKIILDPTKNQECNEKTEIYSCAPFRTLSDYGSQMNMQFFDKYVHDHFCSVPERNKFVQRNLDLMNNQPPPTSWDEVSRFWKNVYNQTLLNNIKETCKF